MMSNEDGTQIAKPLGVEAAILAGVEKIGVVFPWIVDKQCRIACRTVDQADFGESANTGHDVCLRWRAPLAYYFFSSNRVTKSLKSLRSRRESKYLSARRGSFLARLRK